MCVIVLKESLGATVENFDLLIGGARCETGTIWMELDTGYHTTVVKELMHDILRAQVPQFYRAIVTTGGDHARIHRELRGSHPVSVAFECKVELTLFHVPNLDQLIV